VRLLDLGLDPFNFADALLGVVGQRLARRLCTACHTSSVATGEELDMLAHEYCADTELDVAQVLSEWRSAYGDRSGAIVLRRACGCEECDGSGYKGRLGVHELLRNSPAVKRKILAGANVEEIVRQARAEGMITLRQDGIQKVLQGHTDWDQIRTI
jgi:type II secretory ATPase GspE/PulE/Tfp pilus assembly ATPase PilB-like protein